MPTVVQGLPALNAALRRKAARVGRAATKEALNAGYAVQRDAWRRAPRVTKYMANNIGVYSKGDEVAVAAGMVSEATELQGFSHAGGGPLDVDYTVYVHDGTARMAARPFLAAAAAAYEAKYLRDQARAIKREL